MKDKIQENSPDLKELRFHMGKNYSVFNSMALRR